jgi:hypothetical protein
MLTIALAALLSLQDDVAKQAARVGEKDSRASFDAVSRLADLAAASRPAVEAAAAKLPDFYRDVLLEELRARERMGGRYPKVRRLSIDAKDQPPLTVFSEINAKHGEALELSFFNRGAAAGAPVTLRIEDASFMEALDAACRQCKAGVMLNGTRLAVNPFQANVGMFSFRHCLVQVTAASRSRKIEFGAGETRSFRLTFQLLWESDAGILRVVKARVTDAVDSGGKAVAALPEPPAEPAPPRKEGDPVVVTNVLQGWNQEEVALEVPPGDTLKRLRGWYDVLMVNETSSFEFASLDKEEKKGDDHYAVEAGRKKEGDQLKLVIRVTPKAGVEAFLKSSVEVRGVWSGSADMPLYLQGRVVESRVEYTLALPTSELAQQVTPDLKSITLRIHRAPFERRIPFEFIDLPVK